MSTGRAHMPLPQGEMTPQQLVDLIQDWAEAQGYEFETTPHASEFVKIAVVDPNGGYTGTVIPNAHRGRRLRRDQIRYVIQKLNSRWKD